MADVRESRGVISEGGATVESAVPIGEAFDQPEPGQPQSLLEIAKKGEAGEKAVAQRIVKWWTNQDEEHTLYREEWRVNKARRRGLSNVRLIKSDTNIHQYTLYAPPNLNLMPSTFNKADRLCRRINSFMFTDPPMPEATPARDDDDAREAAEAATRILQALTSEGDIDDVRSARRAFDLACTYDSAFRHHFVDPRAGGQRPVRVMCHPQAQSLAHVMPQPLDPTTGTLYPGPFVEKFVRLSGELTTDRSEENLRMQWYPKIRTEVLSGLHVRFLPSSAYDIWEADGVLIASFQRLGQLKSTFSKLQELDRDKLNALVSDHPVNAEGLLPRAQEAALRSQLPNDDALVFTITHYRKQGHTEEQGVYAVVVGKDILAHIRPWMNPRTNQPMDIPLDQFKQFDDEDSPYGRGMMRQLGGGNELLALGFDAVVSHMMRMKNRRVFIPTNSIVQPKQLQSPTGTAIPVNPGGEPKYEEVPSLPSQYFQFIDAVNDQMNDESALQEVAQGVNTPSVQSGLHARQIIEQSIVSLSDLRQNTERALVRGYRLYTQLVKAYFRPVQEIMYLGVDGQQKIERFTGASFADTEDVRIHKGSFTQLSPPAKAAEAERMFAMIDPITGERMMTLQELKAQVMGNVGGLIGIQDDPSRLRIRRQIQVWKKGPGPDFAPAFQQRQAAQQELQNLVMQVQAGAMPPEAAQAQAQQLQQIIEQPLPTPFDQRPVDQLQEVARMRHFELAKAMSSTKFAEFPPPWQSVLVEAYEQARQAAGIQTVQEQQQAAQQQVEAEQQAAQQEQEGQAQQGEADNAADLERTRIEQGAKVRMAEIEGRSGVMTAREQSGPDVRVNVDV